MAQKIYFGFLALLVFLSVSVKAQAQHPNAAQVIPDFTLFRADKSAFTNKDLNTDKLLFFIFFDVKCEHCRHAFEILNKRFNEMNNTMVHLVTLDKPEEVNLFLKKYGKNIVGKKNVMLFFDLRNEFIVKFKPAKYPSLFLYSPQHKLIIYDDNPERLPEFFEKIKSWPK